MYSSDLSRAADTAKAIAGANEASTCQLVLDKRLRERSFGVMEGKKFSELQYLMKELCLTPQTYTPENGERIEQVSKRALQFFKDLCEMVVISSEELDAVTSHSSLEVEEALKNSGESSNECTMATTSTSSGASISTKLKTESSTDIVGSQTCFQQSNTVESKHESQSLNTCPKYVEKNILIVSHGLLMKELKRLILDRFKGNLIGDKAAQNQRFSPNTGVSNFTLTASKNGKKIRVICTHCHFINCSDHLRRSSQNLVTEAKYQDTV